MTDDELEEKMYALELKLQKARGEHPIMINSGGRIISSQDNDGNHYNRHQTLVSSIRSYEEKLAAFKHTSEHDR